MNSHTPGPGIQNIMSPGSQAQVPPQHQHLLQTSTNGNNGHSGIGTAGISSNGSGLPAHSSSLVNSETPATGNVHPSVMAQLSIAKNPLRIMQRKAQLKALSRNEKINRLGGHSSCKVRRRRQNLRYTLQPIKSIL